ncbi:MAG TPA: polysaccharide deacetylase family protein [Casimicrobiaceae bacterium]|nr:polysaccharide deacetylase family protein [Casimicrobiaceae bacterium]
MGSIGLHVTALAGLVVAPESWPWALAAIAANHLMLTIAGLIPRSTVLGPNLTRLPDAAAARREVALTFDDGPDPDVTPRVLAMLDARGVSATFFCIANAAARHPELCREIARRGHAVENHSRRHRPTFPMLGMRRIRSELAFAQRILGELTGRTPRFFRPPAGLRNPLLDPVLHAMGLRLVSWTRRGFDTRTSDADKVSAALLRGLAAGDILLLHDGHASRTVSGTPVVLDVLPRVLDRIQSLGFRPVTLHQAFEP